VTLSPQFLDEVRGRLVLSALIGRTVKIAKAGREHKGCCPFHGEKTPSFTVNDEKGFFHCFSCGAHGDGFDWLTRTQGLGFIEAVRLLADDAGLVLPERSPAETARAQRITGLRPVLEAAQTVFAGKLAEEAAALAYLHERGFSDEVIAAFGLGWAPAGGCLRGQGFGQRAMMDAGLIGESDGGFTYERFKARVTIPVHDGRGRIIGFGGRVFVPEKKGVHAEGAEEGRGAEKEGGVASAESGRTRKSSAPKYVNSPGSEIFDKGRTLFNWHRAAPRVATEKRLLVVEGYMDVIALAQAGFGAAVAPMGTALTVEQLERLWQLHQRPVLLFDGDAAGQAAALRACETAMPFIGPARQIAVAVLPAGVDPDDLLRGSGAAALEAVIDAAKGLHDFVFDAVAGVVG
jgi:DNA primase